MEHCLYMRTNQVPWVIFKAEQYDVTVLPAKRVHVFLSPVAEMFVLLQLFSTLVWLLKFCQIHIDLHMSHRTEA